MGQKSELCDQAYIQRMLSRFNFLAGSVLIEANFREFGSVLELVLEGNFLYPGVSAFSGQDDYSNIVLLRLMNIQDIVYQARIFDDSDLTCMPWEPGELDHIRIINDPAYLRRFDSLALLFSHIQIKWKNKRRMQVVFSGMEVIMEEIADQFALL